MCNRQTTMRDKSPVLIGIKDGCVVIEEIEGAAGFRKAAGAETSVPEGMDDLRGLPVGDVLHPHQAPGKPYLAIAGLVYLEIRIIPFVIPLVVPETGLRFYPLGKAHLKHQGIPDGGPHFAF